MKRAIVLSGGGSKGAYQIGFWKALKKLNIKYDIVTGSSVGALNGAFMTQNVYYKTYYNWNKGMDFSRLFGKDIINDFTTNDGKKEFIKVFGKDILQGGMDSFGLENILKKYIKPEKIKKSNIDFGLITFNLTTMKPIEITKHEIKDEEIVDYLMASATCFPAFKIKDINGEKFIDGGYYDNLPINLAIKMGATEVIAVDLRSISFKQEVKNKNIPITTIKPSKRLPSGLAFNKRIQRKLIKLGYNDTMKVLGKYDGHLFTFKPEQLNKNYNKYIDRFMYNFNFIFNNDKKSIIAELLNNTIYNKLINNKEELPNTFNEMIEYTGKIFKLDETKIYTINNYNSQLIKKLSYTSNLNTFAIEKIIKEKDFKNLLNTTFIIKHIYNKLKKRNIEQQIKGIRQLAIFFPREALSALYLYTIERNKKARN
ncbi:MAG: patatin-like phospholipase family protein [Tenericutes bacterium]|nr:patatin-like phospholipase family protein [Mycoplasmatota bacterium]